MLKLTTFYCIRFLDNRFICWVYTTTYCVDICCLLLLDLSDPAHPQTYCKWNSEDPNCHNGYINYVTAAEVRVTGSCIWISLITSVSWCHWLTRDPGCSIGRCITQYHAPIGSWKYRNNSIMNTLVLAPRL